jgi:hypothetical protein
MVTEQVIDYIIIVVCLQMHDRRVAMELDEFCRGTTLRANSELAEVMDGVMAYLNYMHKIWPLEPGP